MVSIEWLDFVILLLASFRLTRLIVFDEMSAFIRKPFLTVTYENNDDGELLEYIEFKGTGLRRWIGKLLSCHWCTGVWSSFFIIIIYLYLPMLYPLLIVLAIAGGAAIIQVNVDRWM